VSWSSGISASLAPWYLGMTSCRARVKSHISYRRSMVAPACLTKVLYPVPPARGPMMIRTAWPLLSGPMSRNAKVFSLSKSFMQGISPGITPSGSHVSFWTIEVALRISCLASSDPWLANQSLPLMMRQKMQAIANWGSGLEIMICTSEFLEVGGDARARC
jgi:hypothetical protein